MTINLSDDFFLSFSDKDYRDAVVAENVTTRIAFQLESMRKSRNLTQAELAEIAGMRQQSISRLEAESDSRPSISTLLRLAQALDVALIVKFASFGELAGDLGELNECKLDIPGYVDEAAARSTASAVNTLSHAPKKAQTYLNLFKSDSTSERLQLGTKSNKGVTLIRYAQGNRWESAEFMPGTHSIQVVRGSAT
jgi:transcriptional regulator with XRE-family HTH domain